MAGKYGRKRGRKTKKAEMRKTGKKERKGNIKSKGC